MISSTGQPLEVAAEVEAGLRAQLGLAIQNRDEPAEVIVVDPIEQPSQN